MEKKCQRCNNIFEYNGRNHWRVKYCSDKCREKEMCHRYWNRHKEKERKRKLENYYKLRSTEEGKEKIRETNYRANLKRRFGIKSKDDFLKKFKYKCVYCNNKATMIHHLDHNGRGNKNPNNDENNLVACCRSCHAKLHLLNRKLQMKRKSDTPSNRRLT